MTWVYLVFGLYLTLVLASFFLDPRGRPCLPWRHEPSPPPRPPSHPTPPSERPTGLVVPPPSTPHKPGGFTSRAETEEERKLLQTLHGAETKDDYLKARHELDLYRASQRGTASSAVHHYSLERSCTTTAAGAGAGGR